MRYKLTMAATPTMSETVNLNRLAYFAAVVDTGSFTRAAERLGVTKTEPRRVSRRLHFLRRWSHHDEAEISEIRP
ncbi:Transcriptional regulator, LysR family [Azospirillum doebereinerae]